MIPLEHTLIIAAILFFIGLIGMVINRNNLIILLMCVELMLLSVSTNLLAFSHQFNQAQGDVFVFFILTVAAVESAIGLAILVLLYRQHRGIDADNIQQLKG
jgi:NADH-quinone oxidoreductase subunit K